MTSLCLIGRYIGTRTFGQHAIMCCIDSLCVALSAVGVSFFSQSFVF